MSEQPPFDAAAEYWYDQGKNYAYRDASDTAYAWGYDELSDILLERSRDE